MRRAEQLRVEVGAKLSRAARAQQLVFFRRRQGPQTWFPARAYSDAAAQLLSLIQSELGSVTPRGDASRISR